MRASRAPYCAGSVVRVLSRLASFSRMIFSVRRLRGCEMNTALGYSTIWVRVAIAASLALVSGRVFAAANEPAHLRVAGALLDDVVRGLLPVMLPGSAGGSGKAGGTSPAAMLTEMKYCGATEKGAGRFRGVIRQTALNSSAPFLLSAREACRPSLAELAKQVIKEPGPADGAAIAEFEATWKPWELRLALLRSIVLAPTKSAPTPELDNRRSLWTISTSDFCVATEAGEPIILHAAPWFAAATIEIAVVLSEGGSPTPPSPSGRSSASAALVAGANLAADLPVAFANQILRRLTWTQPLAIPVDRDVIDLENLTMTQDGLGLTIRGNATPRSIRETVRMTIALDGEDLRVTSVRAQGHMEDCAGQGVFAGVACNLRNSARDGVVGVLAGALAQRYQGQLVRELAGPRELGFSVGIRRLKARGDLLRLGCSAGVLSAVARFGTDLTRKEDDSAM